MQNLKKTETKLKTAQKKTLAYTHPEYRKVRDQVEQYFNRDYNHVQLEVVKKYFDGQEFERIVVPSFQVLADEWLGDLTSEREDSVKREFCEAQGILQEDLRHSYENFCDWLQEHYCEEVCDAYYESENYPMWSTLFEARDSLESEWILSHVDDLYHLGIGVMEGKDSLNAMLFIAGAGYDFYHEHWLPMYFMKGWISVPETIAG